MEIYKKIAIAKQHVKDNPHQKAGHNNYSNYDYYTPEQVDQICVEACQQAGLVTLFSMEGDGNLTHGLLKIVDIETGDSELIKMQTAMPSITATNATQQAGGAMTYTERYLKMSAFGITDNSLDPDSKDNRKQEQAKKTNTYNNLLKRVNSCSTSDGLKKIMDEAKATLQESEYNALRSIAGSKYKSIEAQND